MATLKRRLAKLAGDRGSELVELAIVFPILLLVIAGIADFGFLFQRYEVVTNAAREGARMGILSGYTIPDVQTRVQNYLTSSGLTDPGATTDVSYGTQTVGAFSIATVTVTVKYPSSFLFIGPIAGMIGGGGGPGTVTLQAVSMMRVEAAAGS